MIEVNVHKGSITVNGHARGAPYGKDIICASVSALTQNLIRSIIDLTDDKIEYEISPGWVDMKFEDLSKSGNLLVDSFFIGICAIANEYPDHVRIVSH